MRAFDGMLLSRDIPHLRSLLRSSAAGDHHPAFLGHQLHSFLLKTNLLCLLPLLTSLFHFYATAGPPRSARLAFALIPSSSLSAVDWTHLISCHSRHSLFPHSLSLFRSMLRSSSKPDDVSLLSALSASARLAHLAFGQSAHLLFFKLGVPFGIKSYNAAIDMYVKCSRMGDAWRVLGEIPEPNDVSWSVILMGVVKFEGVENARKVFDEMPMRNLVACTAMVVGYVEAGRPREALSVLAWMSFEDRPTKSLNGMSVCSVLSACSQAGDLAVGRWVHAHAVKSEFWDVEDVVMVNTALIDMYAKCGLIGTARVVFDAMRVRNLVAWNAMLNGLSIHGMGCETLRHFSRMVEEGSQKPDEITFVSILSACSRSGLVEDGQRVFNDLGPVYGLKPRIEHYACMVDLLGRAGKLEEAKALMGKMPMPPNEVVLGSLLASCGFHGRIELGKRLMHELVEMYPDNTEYHVLLSNLYLSHGRHAEADELWQEVRQSKTRKGPGISYIEVDGHVHQFSAGDKSHPRTQEVYAKLDEMGRRLQLVGYVPNATSHVSRIEDSCLENGEEREEREQALLSHSERLAIAFGLITTRPGVSLRIFKNLRICSDCHTAVKLVSDIYNREIIVRDRNRFHCFKHGRCSCSDYW